MFNFCSETSNLKNHRIEIQPKIIHNHRQSQSNQINTINNTNINIKNSINIVNNSINNVNNKSDNIPTLNNNPTKTIIPSNNITESSLSSPLPKVSQLSRMSQIQSTIPSSNMNNTNANTSNNTNTNTKINMNNNNVVLDHDGFIPMKNIQTLLKNSSESESLTVKRIMKNNYEELLKLHKQKGTKFQDNEFPPTQKSFGDDKPKVRWVRASQQLKQHDYKFAPSRIQPQNMLQGQLMGDCFIVCSLAGLAQKQERILNLFPSLQLNQSGIYMARILHDGIYQEVIVDDYFPMTLQGRFAGTIPFNYQYIYTMVLEKCYAKLYGSYANVESGFCYQPLHAFTAAPAYHYSLMNLQPQEFEVLFQKMAEADKKQYVICAGTGTDSTLVEGNIVQRHAYTVLSIYQKFGPSQQEVLKLRNPYGEHEWMGALSENDKDFWSKISKEQKNKIGYKVADDGIFFMRWKDVIKYFNQIDICKCIDSSSYYYEPSTFRKNQPKFFIIQNRSQADVTIGFSQKNLRGKDKTKYTYSPITLIISSTSSSVLSNYMKTTQNLSTNSQIQPQEYTNIKYISAIHRGGYSDIFLQIQSLPEGTYILYVLASGGKQSQINGVVSTYSTNLNIIKEVPKDSIEENNFLEGMWLNHARNHPQNQQRFLENAKENNWISFYFDHNCGLGYTVIHISNHYTKNVGFQFSQEEYTKNSIQLRGPLKGAGDFKIVCSPGYEYIIVCQVMSKNRAYEAQMPIPKWTILN